MESLIKKNSILIRVPSEFVTDLDKWITETKEKNNVELSRGKALDFMKGRLFDIDIDISIKKGRDKR
jgi:hypothetical protein